MIKDPGEAESKSISYIIDRSPAFLTSDYLMRSNMKSSEQNGWFIK